MNLQAWGSKSFFDGERRRRALYSTAPAVSRAPFFSRLRQRQMPQSIRQPIWYSSVSFDAPVKVAGPKTATKVRIAPGGVLTDFWKGRFMHMNEPAQMGAYFSRQQLSARYVRPRGREVFRFHGLGAEPLAPAPTTGLFAQLTELAKQALPVYQQAKILREQEKRRAAGLAPLESEQLAPTVRVQAGVDPGIMNLGKTVLYGGLAIGGGLLLMTVMRRPRR